MSDGVTGSREKLEGRGEGIPGHKRNAVPRSIIKGSFLQKLTFEQIYLKKIKKGERWVCGRRRSMERDHRGQRTRARSSLMGLGKSKETSVA